MLIAQDYLNLVQDRGKKGLPLERVYRNIRRQDLFLMAYKNLYANAGATTAGTDPTDTVDGMSIERIARIIRSLRDRSFRWKPTRRTYIPKSNGKKRPLGIPGWTDKMVQEVIRLVLEAYYEPKFSKHSHGFRPNRGCHSALDQILNAWTGTRWFIEGDIKGCFDNIDHEILLEILSRDIQDNQLMKLIRTMIEAGYVDDWKYHPTYSGTPQGGVVSPILANIYLNELDQFVEHVLMPKYNKGKRRRHNPVYQRIMRQRQQAKMRGDKDAYKHLTREMVRTPCAMQIDPNYRRLRYVRYADDFLLGFDGPKVEAEEIKAAIATFLNEQLNLEMSEEKTLITNAARKPARFLGYDIHIVWEDTKRTNGSRSTNGKSMLRVPRDVRQQWIAKFSKKGKPASRNDLLAKTDFDIAMYYQVQLQGLVNYYQKAVNVSRRLHWVKSVMMESLVKTLANKHKTSTRRIYRKYAYKPENGTKGLRVPLRREGKPDLVAYFGTKPIHYQRMSSNEPNDRVWAPGNPHNELSARLMADECELCGSREKVQVHHIRKLADAKKRIRKSKGPSWALKMAKLRRKTLVVCEECHRNIHSGQHDGAKLIQSTGERGDGKLSSPVRREAVGKVPIR